MLTHILAEIIGTFIYVGSHHITQSNPAITALSLFIAMTLLNQFTGGVGVSLNPLASLMSFLFGEQKFIEIGIIILAQVLTAVGLFYFLKTMKISVF
jgi:hypothetical protein